MLKVFLGFLVSVVGLLSSAYVLQAAPQAYAASANVVISQIQAGGVGAATQEFIVLYNNSPETVDVTDWCLKNKNDIDIACLSAPIGQTRMLPAYGYAVVVSSALAGLQTVNPQTTVYEPLSQSSGSIVGGNDIISLVDRSKTVIDQHSWVTSLSAGMQYQRSAVGMPLFYQDTDTASDWTITLPGTLPDDQTQMYISMFDACPNLEGIQPFIPFDMELDEMGECVARVIVQIDITEILPNAEGSDEGTEFIELYNPNDQPVDLANYMLYIGLSLDKSYNFPDGIILQPHEYRSFSNSDIPFTLVNSSSLVLLTLLDGMAVSEVPQYDNPKDGESWALIDGQWQYTSTPTPGAANTVVVAVDPPKELETPAALKPCASNQYRSPETNRCRLIVTASAAKTVTPCKEGQYRNETTNRCRNIAVAATPTACKEGQERNPDTNRCRTITKMPSADYAVLGAQTDDGGKWYVWAAVGGVLLVAIAYAVWEWHGEIGKIFRSQYSRVLRFARIRK